MAAKVAGRGWAWRGHRGSGGVKVVTRSLPPHQDAPRRRRQRVSGKTSSAGPAPAEDPDREEDADEQDGGGDAEGDLDGAGPVLLPCGEGCVASGGGGGAAGVLLAGPEEDQFLAEVQGDAAGAGPVGPILQALCDGGLDGGDGRIGPEPVQRGAIIGDGRRGVGSGFLQHDGPQVFPGPGGAELPGEALVVEVAWKRLVPDDHADIDLVFVAEAAEFGLELAGGGGVEPAGVVEDLAGGGRGRGGFLRADGAGQQQEQGEQDEIHEAVPVSCCLAMARVQARCRSWSASSMKPTSAPDQSAWAHLAA